MSQRTPLGKVRGLGSAKDGTDHFWKQRVTGVANLILVCWMFVVLAKIAGADFQTVKSTLARPQNAIAITLLMLSASMHMRLGMQVIIEDYVHVEWQKMALIIGIKFLSFALAAACVLAVVKIFIGA